MSESSAAERDVYWKSGELQTAENCLACDSTRLSTAYAELEDLLGQVPGDWGFVQCGRCQSLNLSPRPAERCISKAYPANYVTHSNLGEVAAGENGSGAAWALVNAYANSKFGSNRTPALGLGRYVVPLLPPIRLQVDYFFRHLPRKAGRLLDVGCGHGAFLQRAADAGWEVEGIEPDPSAASVARSRGMSVFASSIEGFKPRLRYDRITLSHVFEHLHHPARDLRILRDWLADEGELWMAMPNPGGLGHRVFGRNWFSLDPPRHLMLARMETVRAMLVHAGFTSIRFERRGRGARSSLLPSAAYRRRRRGRGSYAMAKLLCLAVDLLSSVMVSTAEEIVVRARRPSDQAKQ